MNLRIFLAFSFILATTPTVWAGGLPVRFAKKFTFSEFSAATGVKVESDTVSELDDLALPIADYDMTHPIKKVTISFYPRASFFSPQFFKNFPGFEGLEGHSGIFPSGLKLHLVVAGPDKALLSCTPVAYELSSSDGEMHITFTFFIAADSMQNAYLLLDELFPRRGGQDFLVYLGTHP